MYSTIVHGDAEQGKEVITAMDRILGRMKDAGQAAQYASFANAQLDSGGQKILEALVQTESRPYHSEFTRRLFMEGRIEGRDEGRLEEARRMLPQLAAARGMELNETQSALLRACQDPEELERWLVRVVTASSLDEVFR